MNVLAIVSLAADGLRLAKTYWPVITAGIVLLSKVVSGDQSGVSEAVAMLLAAYASVHSGDKAAKAVQSIESRAITYRFGMDPAPGESKTKITVKVHDAPDSPVIDFGTIDNDKVDGFERALRDGVIDAGARVRKSSTKGTYIEAGAPYVDSASTHDHPFED